MLDARTWLVLAGLALLFGCEKKVAAPPSHPAALQQAAADGGDYLARSVKQDGQFIYRYDPLTDSEPGGYNLPRHAGTIFAMYQLYDATHEPKLHVSGQRALAWLLQQVRPAKDNPQLAIVAQEEEDGKVTASLGGSALTIIAICQYTRATGDRSHLATAQRLADWICHTQADDGSFTLHKHNVESGQSFDFSSEYYPGEATLALAMLYGLVQSPQYLDAADKAASYLILVRDRDKAIPDHWLMQGLDQLHRHRPKAIFLDHASRLARQIIAEQHGPDKPAAWVGGWYRPPRSTPASIRVEGLCAAWRLARDFNRPDDAAAIAASVRSAMAFLLPMQYGSPSVQAVSAGDASHASAVRNPDRAHGGVRAGPDIGDSDSNSTYEIRNDYVQHFISAMLGAIVVLQ